MYNINKKMATNNGVLWLQGVHGCMYASHISQFCVTFQNIDQCQYSSIQKKEK